MNHFDENVSARNKLGGKYESIKAITFIYFLIKKALKKVQRDYLLSKNINYGNVSLTCFIY